MQVWCKRWCCSCCQNVGKAVWAAEGLLFFGVKGRNRCSTTDFHVQENSATTQQQQQQQQLAITATTTTINTAYNHLLSLRLTTMTIAHTSQHVSNSIRTNMTVHQKTWQQLATINSKYQTIKNTNYLIGKSSVDISDKMTPMENRSNNSSNSKIENTNKHPTSTQQTSRKKQRVALRHITHKKHLTTITTTQQTTHHEQQGAWNYQARTAVHCVLEIRYDGSFGLVIFDHKHR